MESTSVCSPWRRFFARTLDLYMYSAIWSIFLALALGINLGNRGIAGEVLDGIMTLVLMLLLEPVILQVFGTTVGKSVLGLSVTNNEGKRLTYKESVARSWSMLCYGMGFSIPIYSWVRHWKCYKACEARETLAWEYESKLHLKDKKSWRIMVYIGSWMLVLGGMCIVIAIAEAPRYRGEITVAQFCENYNRLSHYAGGENHRELSESGVWCIDENIGYIVGMAGSLDEPKFIFTEEDGKMTGLQFVQQVVNSEEWIPSYQEERLLCVLAFVRAQEEWSILSQDLATVTKQIVHAPFEGFDTELYGVRIRCDIAYDGYNETGGGVMWPKEDVESYYTMVFSMSK